VLRALILGSLLLGCGGGGDSTPDAPSVPAVFPDDYATTYTEVRGCRLSLEHDLFHIKVLADPAALTPYNDHATAFPVGAVVLKEQYGEDDDTCSGAIVKYTVMQKLAAGAAPADIDWTWQEVKADFKVDSSIDIVRCTSCHKECVEPPGYDGTCTEP
jgi:Cytochrome P460